MGEILFKALACAGAALLAWAVCEPSAPQVPYGESWAQWEIRFIFFLILAIALTAGLIDGWRQGGKVHLLRGAGLGLVFGTIFGGIGYGFGADVYKLILGPEIQEGISPTLVLARTLAFTLMGTCLGAGIGLSNFNVRRMWAGFIGGGLGGAVAGATFDLIGMISAMPIFAIRGGSETGSISRAVAAVVLGASIGLFTALIDRLSRRAWLRLVLGRNEGKEWPIDAAATFLGRSERAHIPLFGDPNVMPMHCQIVRQGAQYILVDGGSPIGVGLNGQRIAGQALLQSGDVLHVGPHNLQFCLRGGARPAVVPEARGYAHPVAASPMTPAASAPTSLPSSQPTTAFPASSISPATVAMPAASTWTLVATNGPLTGQRFPVGGAVTLGRDSIEVPLGFDTMASRRHVSLQPTADGLIIQDLGSTNGTLLNGQRVQSATARRGDTIQVGTTVFRLE
ncbi:MAG TPA: FHA domain-containing protein [Fimbriimonadaceae bacterium]|nr:FHA domain-containing protein [Fimbriimonadaceae bacterium]HRJ32498.1 FHA domain-containing protein [Fimbriimonadaceae bacterium]